MKTKAMKKILSMLLVCVMLVGALAGFNVFAAGETTVEIAAKNVWYGDALYPMFAVKTAAAQGDIEVTITDENGDAVAAYYYGTEVIDGDTCYVYVAMKGVAAQNINAEYTFTATVDSDEATATYSILEYLYERLYVDAVEGDEKAAYDALIAYATAADVYLNEGANAIDSLYYVNVEGGVSGIYKENDVIKATTDREAGAGEELVWIVTGTDGNLIDTLTLEEMADTGYTIGTIGVIITLGTEVVGAPEWTLVTDASALTVGDQIVIVAADSAFALSTTQNGNNRGQAAVVKDGNTITFGADVQIITLEAGTTAGTLAFNVGDGYLYAASSSKNYLRTEASLSANSSWIVTITDGVTSIVAQGANTRNTIYYNKASSLFSAYSGAQQAVCIYKLG